MIGEAIQASPFGAWAGGGIYPVANVVHLLGLIMLVGGIGILDLRLAGLFRSLPVPALSAAVTPTALAGLALMVPTGATMFAADAAALVDSTTFRWKLVLIGLALANAVAFRMLWGRKLNLWTTNPPIAGRLMAAGSIITWLAVGTLGRMIAYT